MSRFKIKFVAKPDATIPMKASERASCYDLFAYGFNSYLNSPLERNSYELQPSESVIVRTGISVRLPEKFLKNGYEYTYGIEIKSRSGLAFKHSVEAFHGEIDNDYHKEILVKLTNNSTQNVFLNRKDRIAQFRIVEIPIFEEEVERNEDLEGNSDRGGFGSTGK